MERFRVIKNMKNIIGENLNQEIPFQFFRFIFDEEKKLKIEYQFDDLINLNNKKLREFMAKLHNFADFHKITTPAVKGFIMEELVISTLINNKSTV